jgi:hypothetical protein
VEPTPQAPGDDDDQDPVPLFGSWRAIYSAVIATAILWIVLAAVFSRWPF